MPYEIQTTKHFERLFKKLNPQTTRRIRKKISELRTDPHLHTALTGELKGLRSMRTGDYRVIYTTDEEEKKIRLLHVDHRRAVYR